MIMAVSRKTAEQQRAAMMALMEAQRGPDPVLDVRTDIASRDVANKPRKRHNKHADVATAPASFRLPITVLKELEDYSWDNRVSRAEVVAQALREFFSKRK